jgi:hypothetical protein
MKSTRSGRAQVVYDSGRFLKISTEPEWTMNSAFVETLSPPDSLFS